MLTNDAGTGQVLLSVSTGSGPVPRDDVAAAVSYLASPEASYVTGASIAVDGGYTAR